MDQQYDRRQQTRVIRDLMIAQRVAFEQNNPVLTWDLLRRRRIAMTWLMAAVVVVAGFCIGFLARYNYPDTEVWFAPFLAVTVAGFALVMIYAVDAVIDTDKDGLGKGIIWFIVLAAVAGIYLTAPPLLNAEWYMALVSSTPAVSTAAAVITSYYASSVYAEAMERVMPSDAANTDNDQS